MRSLSPAQLQRAGRAVIDAFGGKNKALHKLRQQRIELARRDVNAFMEFVLRTPTGSPIRQSAVHRRWHDLIDAHDRLILWGSIETGKSEQISIGRTLWAIGNNPQIRVCVVSKTEKQALRIVRSIAGYLLGTDFRAVFPQVRPSTPWNAHALFITANHTMHPTAQALGLHGNILGARIDLLIIDDPLSYENTRTEEQREDTYNWYQETLTGRLTEQSKVIMVANAWHPRDMLHRLNKEPVWTTERFPIWYPADAVPAWLARQDPPVEIASDGVARVALWPEQWSIARIEKRRLELSGKPLAFDRQFLCVAQDDASQIFHQEWIDKALDRGRREGAQFLLDYTQLRTNYFRAVFCGVDLATKRPASRRKTDDSVFAVVGLHHDGSRQLIWLESGKFYGHELIAKINQLHRRYGCIFWIESNGAQQYIVDFAGQSAQCPTVHSFETHAQNKLDSHFGVESLAVELEMGKWVFPVAGPQKQMLDLQFLQAEMMAYHPIQHSGDRLISLWVSREACRLGVREVTVEPGGNLVRR